MEGLSLYDILAIFRRRRYVFIATFVAIFTVAFLFAMQWSRYRATVTVEIAQPYVATSVTAVGGDGNDTLGLADRRISQIQQKVTSIDSLKEIIARLNLYPGASKSLSPDKLTEIMRNSIGLNFISSSIANPAAVQKETVEQLSAIAFTLSFTYNDPELTKLALDAVVERFIEEEAAQRKLRSDETSSFLDSELTALEGTIKDQEAKIAEFKAQHGESGPSAMMFNQQASINNRMSMQNIDSQIGTTQATIGTLTGQLAGTDPYVSSVDTDNKIVSSPMAQLKTLRGQLASVSGRYGPQHPEVVKLREQIRQLSESGVKDSARQFNTGADNPLYLQLNGQLEAAKAQLASLYKQRAELNTQQKEYDQMLAQNPQLEKEMSQLTLDLDNAKERHRSLKEKRLAAEMKSKLDSGSNSERLRVINPASVPEATSPSRKLILMAGLLFATLGGLVMVVIVEGFSQSVRGAHHLSSLVGIRPLVSIPHIPGAKD